MCRVRESLEGHSLFEMQCGLLFFSEVGCVHLFHPRERFSTSAGAVTRLLMTSDGSEIDFVVDQLCGILGVDVRRLM